MNKYLIIALFSFSFHAHSKNFNIISGKEIPDINDQGTELNREVLENLETNNYVMPNEKNPNFYAHVLANRGGTLLSVGTFRALVTFTNGNFDRLVFVDVAKNILQFNREHLLSIEELSKMGSLAEQRERYYQKFKAYLDFFEPKSTIPYYWQSDEKWQKITQSIRENRIHVIRGNFGSKSSLANLLPSLSELKTSITLDHSNLSQYVAETVTKYAEAIEAFSQVAANNDFAVLATLQNFRQESFRMWPFVVGVDPMTAPSDSESIIWRYWYFPQGRAYLSYVDPNFFHADRLGPLPLEDSQINAVASQVHRLMIENIHQGMKWIENEVELFLKGHQSSAHKQWAPPICIAESSVDKIWEKVLNLSKEHFSSILPEPIYAKITSSDYANNKLAVNEFFSAYALEVKKPFNDYLVEQRIRQQAFYQELVDKHVTKKAILTDK